MNFVFNKVNGTLVYKKSRSINIRALLFAFFVGLFYLLFLTDAAAAVDQGNIVDSHTSFSEFIKAVSGHITSMQKKGHAAEWIVNVEFIMFATYRLTMVVGAYAFDKADIIDVFAVVVLIVMVQTFIGFYNDLLGYLFIWANDVGGVIQKEVVGNSNTWFVVEYMLAMLDKVEVVNNIKEIPGPSQAQEGGLFNEIKGAVVNGVKSVGNSIAELGFDLVGTLIWMIVNLCMWTLNIIIFIGIAWSIWGFALAKLVGLFFVPFMLVERLAPIFDGWLKLLIGFLFYGIIIKVNASLVALMFSTYWDIGKLTLPLQSPPIHVVANAPENVLGLVAMFIVALLAILSTGGFAQTISGGVGGFGGALATAARTAAIVGSGGAGAAAKAVK